MFEKFVGTYISALLVTSSVSPSTEPVTIQPHPDTSIHCVSDLQVSPVSVSCLKVTWTAEQNRDYTVTCTILDSDIVYVDNMCFVFKSNSLCYITGLREGTSYSIDVIPIAKEGETSEMQSTCAYAKTEQVEVIENFPYEDGWTNCFAYENAAGLTRNPSWSAIRGCIPDPITDTGIMRDEYGDYCVAMGTKYGYCNDRFLITLENGIQFTVKICDSKGDVPYHHFGGTGKCVIEFIHGNGQLPNCVAFTGNYGCFSWNGLDFDNIRSIQKINYGNPISY